VVGVLLLLFLVFSVLMNLGLLVALGLHIGGAGGLREELVSGDPTAAEKIALVNLKGVIADTVGGFPTSGAFRSTADELEQAARDAAVKAVVLLVDSPGGEVTASDILCRKVGQFREETKKPVVAIFGSVAASGAYYVSVAADRIIAHPTTVTGSIGVLMTMLNAQGLMEKVGLRSVVLKSAPFKDIGSPFREMTPEEQAVLQGVVDSLFGRFKRIVAEGRKMSAEKVDSLADGRIFTADEALAAGLIDRIGYEEDAIAEARQLAHVPQAKVVRYRRTFRLGDFLTGELEGLTSPRTVTVDVAGLGGPRTARFLYMWLLSGEGLRETP
jgi:protease-4